MDLVLNNETIKALGLENMSEAELSLFAEKAGAIAIDSAIGRLLTSLSEAEIKSLEEYAGTSVQGADVLSHLAVTFPQFTEILSEELTTLRDESRMILGT